MGAERYLILIERHAFRHSSHQWTMLISLYYHRSTTQYDSSIQIPNSGIQLHLEIPQASFFLSVKSRPNSPHSQERKQQVPSTAFEFQSLLGYETLVSPGES